MPRAPLGGVIHKIVLVTLLGGVSVGAARMAPARQGAFRLDPVRGLDELMPVPDDNTLSAPVVFLGRRLFFDPVLSADRTVSCASCHRPEHAFADTLARSRGVHGRAGRRNAPAIVNRGYGTSFFWDGRAGSLEVQVLEPIGDTVEMDLPLDQALSRLTSDQGYRAAFEGAFRDGVSAANLSRALASFVRTIRSGDAAFDRFRDGDSTALNSAARRGAALFFGRANCSACHVGPNFTDEAFHNTGVAGDRLSDGRYTVTRAPGDRGAFKTPTLRDVERTAPYMHDGSVPTLEAVVDFYAEGGRANANLDPEIRPLQLGRADREALVAFLRSLTASAVNSYRDGAAGAGGGGAGSVDDDVEELPDVHAVPSARAVQGAVAPGGVAGLGYGGVPGAGGVTLARRVQVEGRATGDPPLHRV